MKRLTFLLFLTASLFSCEPLSKQNPDDGTTSAYVPVYSTLSEIQKIQIEEPQATKQAGKIYAYQHYVFQNDLDGGIHIINMQDREHPEKIAYLKLPMSTEIAIKGHYLYTNNYKDLLVFDISDAAKPLLKQRVKDVFPGLNQNYPPFSGTYFQCPDPEKGIVVKWEKKSIPTPKCRR